MHRRCLGAAPGRARRLIGWLRIGALSVLVPAAAPGDLYADGADFNVASTAVGIGPLMDQDAAHLRDLAGVQRRGGFGNDAS